MSNDGVIYQPAKARTAIHSGKLFDSQKFAALHPRWIVAVCCSADFVSTSLVPSTTEHCQLENMPDGSPIPPNATAVLTLDYVIPIWWKCVSFIYSRCVSVTAVLILFDVKRLAVLCVFCMCSIRNVCVAVVWQRSSCSCIVTTCLFYFLPSWTRQIFKIRL